MQHSAGVVNPQSTAWVGVEVKRRATLEAVDQLTRYLGWLNADPHLPGGVRGILVAQSVPAQVKKECWARGIKTVVVDYDHLRGIEPGDLRLF